MQKEFLKLNKIISAFLDGNGRIARVMMNAELTTSAQTKIIIPNVYQ
ncbi:hypothetical protein MNBD_BACTEROID03-1218, partial [hydrothermal vent metagenome]